MSILITGASGPTGASLIDQCVARGIEVIGCDTSPRERGDGVEILAAHPAHHPDYLHQLCSMIEDHGIVTVIPTSCEELPILARANLARVVVASPRAVDIANDKWLTTQCLAQAEVAVPRTIRAEDANGDLLADLGTPVLSKPRIARGGRGVRLHHCHNDAPTAPGLVISEFIPGAEYCAQVLRLAGRTRVVVLRKLSLREGLIGTAEKVVRVCDPDIAQLAYQACVAIGICGPADLDIRRRDDGTPVVLEVNARFGSQSAHAPEILSGVLRAYCPRSQVGSSNR